MCPANCCSSRGRRSARPTWTRTPPVSLDLSEALKIETPLPAGYTPSRKHCQQHHFCFLIKFLRGCWLNWQNRRSGTVHVTAAGSRPETVSVATQVETFTDGFFLSENTLQVPVRTTQRSSPCPSNTPASSAARAGQKPQPGPAWCSRAEAVTFPP